MGARQSGEAQIEPRRGTVIKQKSFKSRDKKHYDHNAYLQNQTISHLDSKHASNRRKSELFGYKSMSRVEKQGRASHNQSACLNVAALAKC